MLPIWVSVCVWRGGGLLADRVTNGAFKPVKESVHHSRKRAGGMEGAGRGKKEGEKNPNKNKITRHHLCKTPSHTSAELISSINKKNPISNKHPRVSRPIHQPKASLRAHT